MISIVINVKNSEQYIERCLNALSKFTDIVLLDNYSTDKTVEIAKGFSNVRVFQHEFCGMGKVRNIAASFAKYDWVFFVDSDEIINKQLVDKILNTSFKDNWVYKVSRHNYYDNFLIGGASWGNDWVLRIYNRKQTQFMDNEVHEAIIMDGLSEKKIHGGFLYHFPYENISKLIDKLQFYSTLYARQNLGKKKVRLYLLPFRTVAMFIKCYILQRGFKYGYEGLIISVFNAIGVFTKYIKLYELSYKRNIALAAKIDNLEQCLLVLEKINQQTLLPNLVIIMQEDLNRFDLDEKLKTALILPSIVITINSLEDIPVSLNNQLLNDTSLNNIVYFEDILKIADQNIFKNCKQAILERKQLHGAKIY